MPLLRRVVKIDAVQVAVSPVPTETLIRDTGGSLDQQLFFIFDGPVHTDCHFPLAPAIGRKWKFQLVNSVIARNFPAESGFSPL